MFSRPLGTYGLSLVNAETVHMDSDANLTGHLSDLPTTLQQAESSEFLSVIEIFHQLSLHSPRAHATVSRFSRLCFAFYTMA